MKKLPLPNFSREVTNDLGFSLGEKAPKEYIKKHTKTDKNAIDLKKKSEAMKGKLISKKKSNIKPTKN